MRVRWQAAVAWLFMLASVASFAVTLVVAGGGIGDKGYAFVVVFSGSFTALALVGGLLAVKRPGNLLGWLLLVSGLCTVLAIAAAGYLEQTPQAPPWVHLLIAAWIPGAVAGLVLVPLLFPTGRPPTARWRWVGWMAAAAAAAMLADIVVAFVLYPDLVAQGWEAYDEATSGGALVRLVDLSWPALLVAAVLAWTSVVVRFRRSRGVERQQLKWFVLAAGLTVAFIIFSNSAAATTLPWVEIAFGAVALPSVSVAIGVAVLRYRLYEIDRIISRTLSYALLTALLGGIYLGAVLLLAPLLGRGSDLAVAGATLAAAAAFGPLRRRVQAAVDRRFNRARYDAQRTVEAFALRLREEVDLEQLQRELLGVVAESVQPAATALWLRPAAGGRP